MTEARKKRLGGCAGVMWPGGRAAERPFANQRHGNYKLPHTRCQWAHHLPIFVSGNGLLRCSPQFQMLGQLLCRRGECPTECPGRVMFHPLSPKVNGH